MEKGVVNFWRGGQSVLWIINFVSQLIYYLIADWKMYHLFFYLFLFSFILLKDFFILLIAYLRKSVKTLTQVSMKIFKISFFLSLLS